MIAPGPVLDEVLTVLTTATAPVPVGDLRAPAGDPKLYAVLEYPPSPPSDGDLADPEAHLNLRFTVRAVGIDADTATARRAATHVLQLARARIMDRTSPIDGDGWVVTGRSEGGISVDVEGVTVNALQQFVLWVVPGPEAL